MKIDSKVYADSSTAANATPKKSGGTSFQSVLASTQQPTAAQELETYLKKSPVERMMEMILKSLGETPQSLAAKSPQEQAAIMAKVNAILKQKMETAAQTGGSPTL